MAAINGIHTIYTIALTWIDGLIIKSGENSTNDVKMIMNSKVGELY
jgi:hypothetical protein